MSTLDDLNSQLTAANTALTELLTGAAITRVRKDGKWLDFKPANAEELKAYISDLKSQIASISGSSSGSFPRRPLRLTL